MRTPDWLTARPIAHRGLHDKTRGVIENTPGAALAAVEKAFAIECDVQLSADGEAMVFHDFTLERLTESSGDVGAKTAAELSALTMRGTADHILSLTDFIGRIGGRTPLVVEIKSRFDGDRRLTKRVAEIVAASSAPIVLKSFDPRVLIALRDFAPERTRGIVAMAAYDYPDYASCSAADKHAMANLLHFADSKPDFLSWRVGDLPSAAPYLCRTALGLPLMTWTVRTDADRAKASAHADQIVFEGFVP
jgi:glycerophosphoryl diester phosphodiesterase